MSLHYIFQTHTPPSVYTKCCPEGIIAFVEGRNNYTCKDSLAFPVVVATREDGKRPPSIAYLSLNWRMDRIFFHVQTWNTFLKTWPFAPISQHWTYFWDNRKHKWPNIAKSWPHPRANLSLLVGGHAIWVHECPRNVSEIEVNEVLKDRPFAHIFVDDIVMFLKELADHI